jgi:hypothetical protein
MYLVVDGAVVLVDPQAAELLVLQSGGADAQVFLHTLRAVQHAGGVHAPLQYLECVVNYPVFIQ